MKLIVIILLFGYGFGFYKFWRGFTRTNFQRNLPTKLYLSALWPVLFVSNRSYRQNFTKDLKG